MSVVRQFAQAVLGLVLLRHVVRLLAAAITDGHDRPPPAAQVHPGLRWACGQQGGGVLPGGDVGGDAQLDESFSVRFHHRDHPGTMVTYRYYAALDLDDLTTVYVERQTELLACTDPADPRRQRGLVGLPLRNRPARRWQRRGRHRRRQARRRGAPRLRRGLVGLPTLRLGHRGNL